MIAFACFRFTTSCKFCFCGFADLFNRLKVFQKFFGGGFAYAFYQFQFGSQCAFIAFFAVEGDTKAVRFVTQLLYHFKRFRSFIQVHRVLVAGVIQFFQAFGYTNNGNLFIYTQAALNSSWPMIAAPYHHQ
jgi:hypothetical protein